MAVILIPDKQMNRVVASLPGVRATVRAKAEVMGGTASALLASHRRSGRTHIEIEHNKRGASFRKYDSFVTLVSKDALAVEFGHINSGRYRHLAPRRVGGIHVLRDAMAAHRL